MGRFSEQLWGDSPERHHWAAWSLLVAATAGVMLPIALLDANGHVSTTTDTAVRWGCVLAQVAVAAIVVRRAVSDSNAVRVERVALPYALVIGVAVAGATIVRSTSPWLLLPVVALVAARYVLFPIDASGHRADRGFSPTVLAWTTINLGLQSGMTARWSGLPAIGAAFIVGLLVASEAERVTARRLPSRGQMARGSAFFAAALAGSVVLLPSLSSSRLLLQMSTNQPDGLTLVKEVNANGRFERWYHAGADKAVALAEVTAAFRHPPASVWEPLNDDTSYDLVAHVLGYRIEITYFPPHSRSLPSRQCSTEIDACVEYAVVRSSTID